MPRTRALVWTILLTLSLISGAAAQQTAEQKQLHDRISKLSATLLNNGATEQQRVSAAQSLGQLGPRANGAVPALIQALDSPQKVRMEAVRSLGLIGPGARDAVPELGALLKHRKDVHVLTQALGRIGGKDAPAVIIPLLGEKDKAHWPQCNAALAAIGKDASAAVPHLIKWLGSSDTKAVRMAAYSLDSIGPGSADNIPALINLLGKGRYVERAVVALLSRSGKAALKPLTEALKSDNEKVRLDAIRSLWRNKECAVDAIPILRRHLHDPTDSKLIVKTNWVAVESATGLAHILKGHEDLAEQVIPGLTEALGVEDARLIASGALKGIPKGLEHAFKHKDHKIRAYASKAAGNWQKAGHVYYPTILKLMKEDKHLEVRYSAARALGYMKIHPEKTVPALIDALKDKSARVGGGACIALKAFGKEAIKALPAMVSLYRRTQWVKRPQNPLYAIEIYPAVSDGSVLSLGKLAMPDLVQGLAAKDEATRQESLKVVSVLGPIAVDAVPNLTALLKDDDSETRIIALDALTNIGPAAIKAEPALVPLLDEPDEQIVSRAARTLGAIGAKGRAKELLDLFDHDDSSVRCHAAVALTKIGGKPNILVPRFIDAAKDNKRFHPIAGLPMLKFAVEHPKHATNSLPQLLAIMRGGPATRRGYQALKLIQNMGPSAASAIPELKDIQKHFAKVRYMNGVKEIDKAIELLQKDPK